MIPDNFDWQFYILYYKDLYDHGMRLPENAHNHYIHWGHREGRQVCDIRTGKNGETYRIDYNTCNNDYLVFYSLYYLRGDGSCLGNLDDFKLSMDARATFNNNKYLEKDDDSLLDFIVCHLDEEDNIFHMIKNHYDKLKMDGVLYYLINKNTLPNIISTTRDHIIDKNAFLNDNISIHFLFKILLKHINDNFQIQFDIIVSDEINDKFAILLRKNKSEKITKKSIGFIIIRCVRNHSHNLLWIECYNCIRKLYDEEIIIIDDNSDQNVVQSIPLINARIIKSEFPGARELLPYYYFYKLKPFDVAVCLHDSMFIQKEINFYHIDKCQFIWHFATHCGDNIPLESHFISLMDNHKELYNFYRSNKWFGCFGAMAVVDYNFIDYIQSKYNFLTLVNHVKSRLDGMAMERIIAILCFFENGLNFNNSSICGDISGHMYGYALGYDNYKLYQQREFKNYKIVKVWSGR